MIRQIGILHLRCLFSDGSQQVSILVHHQEKKFSGQKEALF